MLLLHISDIHFRTPDCLTPHLDPERPYRTKLLQDVRSRCRDLGKVGAILVSGDIAFKAAAEEYETALVWLKELAVACGCPVDRIFVTPGNHDVDRSLIAQDPSIRNTQLAIATAENHRRERELRTQFTHVLTGHSLLAPHAAYNNFAKLFGCQIYTPERLYWTQDIDLNADVRLRVHGLTSTLLSGANGGDDRRESLYLSPLQTNFESEDNVINLVMMHHPPDWLMDQDDVTDVINNRATLQLFGHKHRQRLTRECNYIRFSAGAVNPDRGEPGWEPGYNLIRLNITGFGQDRVLEIDTHQMVLQSSPERFVPRRDEKDNPVFHHRISIPGYEAPEVLAAPSPAFTVQAGVAPPSVSSNEDVTMDEQPTHNLLFRFWNLSSSQRREIALGLGLITDEDLSIPEYERYGRALLNAKDRGLLDRVAGEVAEREINK
ncbi:MAG: metallophosphoesterase [Limnobacter sp.]|jgi:3',5'-cyclic AMP phosphodiesterase CpdA|uniref:metallophosphoesterase n=1 Tax=Limnobacter sp. TaxID=2003368 RepID=UPI001D48817D|nr:hypothetical protein [Alcaligenaceae bacterium]